MIDAQAACDARAPRAVTRQDAAPVTVLHPCHRLAGRVARGGQRHGIEPARGQVAADGRQRAVPGGLQRAGEQRAKRRRIDQAAHARRTRDAAGDKPKAPARHPRGQISRIDPEDVVDLQRLPVVPKAAHRVAETARASGEVCGDDPARGHAGQDAGREGGVARDEMAQEPDLIGRARAAAAQNNRKIWNGQWFARGTIGHAPGVMIGRTGIVRHPGERTRASVSWPDKRAGVHTVTTGLTQGTPSPCPPVPVSQCPLVPLSRCPPSPVPVSPVPRPRVPRPVRSCCANRANRDKLDHEVPIMFNVSTLTAVVLVLGVLGRPRSDVIAREVAVYKTPTCGCCAKWASMLGKAGFDVTLTDMAQPELQQLKTAKGVPEPVRSCHTAVIDGYVVEGHVPVDVIQKMLKERPKTTGIAVAGMPAGSPGMESPHPVAYDVLTFERDGKTTVYAKK